ncbi:MAG: hypothetical protein ABFS39_08910 [Pseudomonadota bacterium]
MFDAILLDMDGVLYHGDHPLPGAQGFLQQIQLRISMWMPPSNLVCSKKSLTEHGLRLIEHFQ